MTGEITPRFGRKTVGSVRASSAVMRCGDFGARLKPDYRHEARENLCAVESLQGR